MRRGGFCVCTESRDGVGGGGDDGDVVKGRESRDGVGDGESDFEGSSNVPLLHLQIPAHPLHIPPRRVRLFGELDLSPLFDVC